MPRGYRKDETRFVFTPERCQMIRDHYPTMGRNALAALLGCDPAGLTAKAKVLGVRSLVHRRMHGLTQRMANMSARLDFFDAWTPEMAYVLGYIWADGCIIETRGVPAALGFCCVEDDRKLLEDIARVMDYTGGVRSKPAQLLRGRRPGHEGRVYVSRPQVWFRVKSRHIVDQLITIHGLTPRKSSRDLSFPSNVPDEHLSHFVRGYFDGDGCVHVKYRPGNGTARVAMFCGSPRFLAGLAARVSAAAGITVRTPKPTRSNISVVTWHSLEDVTRLREWMYSEATIWLERKRAKFEQLGPGGLSAGAEPRQPRTVA